MIVGVSSDKQIDGLLAGARLWYQPKGKSKMLPVSVVSIGMREVARIVEARR